MKMLVRPVTKGPGLSLEEAFALYAGTVKLEELDESKRLCVEELEEGKRDGCDQWEKQTEVSDNLQDEDGLMEIVLAEKVLYTYHSIPILLKRPLRITGNGAMIQGCGQDGFYIRSGNITFENMILDHFKVNISLDGEENIINDIVIRKVHFQNFNGAPIQTGTTKSNGGIRNLTIQDCIFENNDEAEHGNVTSGYSSIALNCADAARYGSVDNTVLENVSIMNCSFLGVSRETINVMGGVCGNMFGEETRECRNVRIRNLSICDNSFKGSYDATINVITGFQNNFAAMLDGLTISGNTIEFGLWGIFVIAGEPIFHSVKNVSLKNVEIHHNTMTMREGGCGEPSCGIAVNGGRIDFYSAICTDCEVENITIHHNTISNTDRGIMIDGGHALLDADSPSEVSRCRIKNVVIEENQLKDVETCFLFHGAYFEGRRYDWKIGIPGADIQWQKPVESHDTVTCRGNDNTIEQLTCRNNHIVGYHTMLQSCGAYAAGHGEMSSNTVKNAFFKGNRFEKGGAHMLVTDKFLKDFTRDGGGNKTEITLQDI